LAPNSNEKSTNELQKGLQINKVLNMPFLLNKIDQIFPNVPRIEHLTKNSLNFTFFANKMKPLFLD
jgi:hypothetical protein